LIQKIIFLTNKINYSMKKNKFTLLKWKSRHLIPFLCACLLFYSTVAFAQTTIVQGKVVNTQGETLIGVSIKLKGTSTNTVTNAAGEFKLNIPEKTATIEFSYIGYKTEDVAFKGDKYLNVTLEEDLKFLDEVVLSAMEHRNVQASQVPYLPCRTKNC